MSGSEDHGAAAHAHADPFVRLESTHRRLEARIQELGTAVTDLDHPDPERRDDALDIIEDTARFFTRGARRHVEDEERTLFPHLSLVPELQPVLNRLEEEHREHKRLEDDLAELIRAMQGRYPDVEEKNQLQDLAQELKSLYRAHIDREERELFPQAKLLLTPETIREMGEDMQARRNDRDR